jgi:hypothetical protein
VFTECDQADLSLAGDFACDAALRFDGDGACDRAAGSYMVLDLAAGPYVFGIPGLFDGTVTLYDKGSPNLGCAPQVAGDLLQDPTLLGVELRAFEEGNAIFVVRDANALCPVADDCCQPSGAPGLDACEDAGLVSCVLEAAPYCETEWSFECVAAAVLHCGADCDTVVQ